MPLAPLPAPAKRVTVIPLHNVPPSIVAYQLDPAHNPKPPNWEQIQFGFPQVPEKFKIPAPPSITPALDAFAGVGRKLELQARWVQIDADILPTALPAWQKLGAGAWTRVASPEELRALEILQATGTASIVNRQLDALNNQTANLSFSPFTTFELPLADPNSIDDMVIPRPQTNPIFDSPPYIPNLAKPESKLPEMAPMPNVGGKNDPPFIAPLPTPNFSARPQSRELADLMAYKFQIRPTLIGDRTFSLELRSLNSADNMAATSTLNQGETAVFSLPNILMQSPNKVRRTFLLVTPQLALPPIFPNSKVPRLKP